MLNIGDQLRAARIMRRMTQGQLAAAADTSQSAVSEWENGNSQPSLPLIDRVAQALAFDVVAVLVPWEVTGGADASSLARRTDLGIAPTVNPNPTDPTPAPTA